MSNTQLYIPQKCKVGLQKREGTYTGKLGYIIYHDGKVWRKETSWEGWRHKEGQASRSWDREKQEYNDEPIVGVEPIEFQNVPTEGFVLNKKAGGYSSGWNHRQTYCRVYDPRGWEFEISIPNLLYILQECSAYKGKGLEGEFVYSWEGKDLVLLPVSSPDYKECQTFTDLQSKKIGKRDLVEGHTYLTSKMEKLVYLGQHIITEDTWYNKTDIEIQDNGHVYKSKFDKKFVFRTPGLNDNARYEFLTSFSRLKSKISDEVDPSFAEYVEELQKSEYYSYADHLTIEPIDTNPKNERDLFNSWNSIIYKFGDINDINSFQSLKRKITRHPNIDGKWDINIEKKVKSTSFWGGYNTAYELEGTFTKEEVKENYGILYRVYKNGFKKPV